MNIKRVYPGLLAVLMIMGGCFQKKNRYAPEECLSVEAQEKFLQTMMRYASKLPPEATHETKFNDEFKWYYDKAVKEAQIWFCSFDEGDSTYNLFVARQARSITPMREGVAVKVKFDRRGGFKEYEEVFRTWKMPEDTLKKRGLFLFKTMVNGGDLKLYYSKFQQDRFIEFPDDRFYFDHAQRKWRDKVFDSLRIN